MPMAHSPPPTSFQLCSRHDRTTAFHPSPKPCSFTVPCSLYIRERTPWGGKVDSGNLYLLWYLTNLPSYLAAGVPQGAAALISTASRVCEDCMTRHELTRPPTLDGNVAARLSCLLNAPSWISTPVDGAKSSEAC